MIEIFGAELGLLPTSDALAKALNPQFLAAYRAGHGEVRNESALTASLTGLLLLQAAGVMGNLVYDDRGRPHVTDASCDFNITHTDRCVFCAVEIPDETAAPCRVGLDAEDLSRMSEERISRMARRWFSEAERAWFDATPDEETFLRIWTRKEALMKWIGTGLVDLPRADTVAAEALHCVRFTEYRVGEALLSLCCRDTARTPQEIRMLTPNALLRGV